MKHDDNSCVITHAPADRALEFVLLRRRPIAGLDAADWPLAPGAARRDGGSDLQLLHFAPDRYLAPEPTSALAAQLESAARAGDGIIVEAGGKWTRVDLLGPGATRLLASALDVEAVLGQRDCAAAAPFDCPAVLCRTGDGYRLWLQSSYLDCFLATAAACRASPGDRPDGDHATR